jgi:hypothetical protein
MGRAMFRLGTYRFHGNILACAQGRLWPRASRNTCWRLRRLGYWLRCRDIRASAWLRQRTRVVLGLDLLPSLARFRGLHLSNPASQMSLLGEDKHPYGRTVAHPGRLTHRAPDWRDSATFAEPQEFDRLLRGLIPLVHECGRAKFVGWIKRMRNPSSYGLRLKQMESW